MTRHATVLVVAFVLAASASHASAQAPAPGIGSAPLTRIGIVVRDVNKAVQVYRDIFQLAATPAVESVKIELPKGSTRVKRAVVVLPNVRLEVDQPDGKGPAADYLKKYGQGIYRVGFSTPESIAAWVAVLEVRGGTVTAGSKTGTFAWVDMSTTMGTTLEVRQEAAAPVAGAAAPAAGTGALGTTPMSHLGWAVTNADYVAKSFADAFGIPLPIVRDIKSVEIPPNYPADANATLRLASWKQANTGVELIQSIGKTNWTDFVTRHGENSAPQHLAFPVGDRLRETVELFQSKGASWTNGKAGSSYAYLDFTETLGIIFELNGAWK